MNTSPSSSQYGNPTAAPKTAGHLLSALSQPAESQPAESRPGADAGPLTRNSSNEKRALVLGGGGSTGNAWLIGVIAGLLEAGLDVTRADVTVGTSAGSTAAAQLAGATPIGLFNAIVDAPTQQRGGTVGSGPVGAGAKPVVDHMQRTSNIMNDSTDMADMRRRLGAAAIEMAEAMEGSSDRWRATVATRLPSKEWPEQSILLTAVDARTGDPVVFHRGSGVDLVDAVAASCASGFAYSIGNNQYIDGGYRTNAENADLAAGHGRVLVLAPFGGRTRTPKAWGMHLAGQVETLRLAGSMVETVFPDADSEHLFGVNAMDLSLRPAAATAGYLQGKALAARLAGFWA